MQDNESITEAPFHRPRKRRKSDSTEKIRSNEARSLSDRYLKSYITTFTLLISAILMYDVILISNVHDVDFQALKTELESSVHNQSEALSVMLESLDKVENHEQSVNILNFVGSTGVGKTFIANIVKKHFSPSFIEVRGSLQTKIDYILSTIQDSSYKYNLIVFDDLTISDVDDIAGVMKRLPEDLVILVICIFNIQETDRFLNFTINYDHIQTIDSKFQSAKIDYRIAKFHEFSKDEARDWVFKELVKKGIDEDLCLNIVESILDAQNVKYHGLKGLSSKLNLML